MYVSWSNSISVKLSYVKFIFESLKFKNYSDQDILEIISDCVENTRSNCNVNLTYENLTEIEFEHESYKIVKRALIDNGYTDIESIRIINSHILDSYEYTDGDEDYDFIDLAEEFAKENGESGEA